MKKILILIVAGALYFHFYPNEALNNWLGEQKAIVLDYFFEATDTQVRLKPEKIYQDLSRKFASFNSQEQLYIAEITASREAVKNFYQQHCLNKKQTPKLQRKNLNKTCQTINQYSSLL